MPPKHAKNDAAAASPTKEDAAPSNVALSLSPAAYNVSKFFMFILLIRVFLSRVLPIMDCDEIFNYWEPSHYLVYGYGLKTWEYDAQFQLRSWLYVWIFTLPGYCLDWITGTLLNIELGKVQIFYFTRGYIAILGALAEVHFLEGVEELLGHVTAGLVFLGLMLSPGVASSHSSFLPSSTSMIFYLFAAGSWMRVIKRVRVLQNNDDNTDSSSSVAMRDQEVSIAVHTWYVVLLVSAAAVVAWPFAALVGVPMGVNLLYICATRTNKNKNKYSVLMCKRYIPSVFDLFGYLVLALLLLVSAVSLVDSFYYCQPFSFSTLNIVLYNVFGGEHRGPHLYGVEPWYYFFLNLALNFSSFFAVGLCVTPLFALYAFAVRPAWSTTLASATTHPHRSASILRSLGTVLLVCSPFYLWFAFWTRVPHKEERFFVPAYPFVVLAGASGLSCLGHLAYRRDAAPSPATGSKKENTKRKGGVSKVTSFVCKVLFFTALVAYFALSISRTLAVYNFYGGPEQLLHAEVSKMTRELAKGRSSADIGECAAPSLPWSLLRSEEGSAAWNGGGEASSSPVMIKEKNICVGEQWYRYPSSYFLPSDHVACDGTVTRYKLRFVKTDLFSGMLPLPFANFTRTRSGSGGDNRVSCAVNEKLNDLNIETPEQYWPMDKCDFLFNATVIPTPAAATTTDSDKKPEKEPYVLLDQAATPRLARILYVPWYTEQRAVFKRVVLEDLKKDSSDRVDEDEIAEEGTVKRRRRRSDKKE